MRFFSLSCQRFRNRALALRMIYHLLLAAMRYRVFPEGLEIPVSIGVIPDAALPQAQRVVCPIADQHLQLLFGLLGERSATPSRLAAASVSAVPVNQVSRESAGHDVDYKLRKCRSITRTERQVGQALLHATLSVMSCCKKDSIRSCSAIA